MAPGCERALEAATNFGSEPVSSNSMRHWQLFVFEQKRHTLLPFQGNTGGRVTVNIQANAVW